MEIKPVTQATSPIKRLLTNPKAAQFAQSTICAISVETTLKALGRPTFIYFDKNANGRSKKYAATKELLYQSFCLGLYLGFINKVKKPAYNIIKKHFFNDKEQLRKLDLYDSFQEKIDKAAKEDKKGLREEFAKLIHENKDYKLGKGVHELSSIGSTVFILALCAPILSQIILHPVMDLIFKNKDKKNNTSPVKEQNPINSNATITEAKEIEKSESEI
ncbi:unknown [Clostridium sp. CAG:813]|nr:unknown [Clostridium sp. CAG:813]